MDFYYDVVIIGAGPAGMGCGIVLQKNNTDVCVIDRAVFPRNKTCAGLVTEKTFDLIKYLCDPDEVEGLFCCTSSSVSLYRGTQLLTEAPITKPVRLVNRSEFDNALVEKYRSLGGRLTEGVKRLDIDYESKTISMPSGDSIKYGHLIFADGALSMSHKKLNVDRRRLAFGVEAYVSSELFNTESINLYFDYIDKGYAWAFPHGDTVCIGAADLYDRTFDYKGLITRFLTDLGIDPEGQRYIGAFLPYGYVIPQERLDDNVLLTGDAGGFTDPISGEGLYMALRSGILAAEALSEKEPKKAYLSSLKPLINIVKDGEKVQRMFFSSAVQKIFLDKVRGKRGFVSYFFDEMVNEYHYDYKHIHNIYRDYKKK